MSNTFTYDQHLWDGMKQVIDRFDEGKRTVRDMSKFLDGRANIESDTAKKLQGLCGKPLVKPEGRTLGTGWQAVRTNTEEQFSTRNTLSTVFKELSADLNNYKKEISRQKEQHLATVAGLNRDLEKGKAGVLKAKTLYHQKTQTAETALINYEKSQQDPTVAAKALTKLNTTASKNRKEAEVADQAYQATLQEFQAFQVKFEESMKEILKDFQVIEERRVVKLKEVIDKIVAAQDSHLNDINQQHDTLKVAATKINGMEDVQNFINENKTGLVPPKPTEYEPYKGKHEQFKKKSIPKTVVVSSENSSPKLTKAENPKSGPGPVTNPRSAPSNPKARALYDYAAADGTELGFNAGDIITVTKQDNSGWWEGELNGKEGMFPGNYVELITAAETAAADTRKRCKAKFEFNASSGDELTIKVGDIIYIDTEAAGWYSGTNERGESGLFPANYAELI